METNTSPMKSKSKTNKNNDDLKTIIALLNEILNETKKLNKDRALTSDML